MEQNAGAQTQTQNNSGGGLSGLFRIGIIVAVLLFSFSGYTFVGNAPAKKAAESYVKQDVYESLGLVPKYFRSEMIYKSGSNRLIEVKYGLTSTDWDGTYCVYTNGKAVVNSTTMMGSGYDFEAHLEEVKALFGL